MISEGNPCEIQIHVTLKTGLMAAENSSLQTQELDFFNIFKY